MTTKLIVVSVRISTGRVGKSIIDYISAGARKRIEHEGAQARCHGANVEGQRDVRSRRASNNARIICIKCDWDFGNTGPSQRCSA